MAKPPVKAKKGAAGSGSPPAAHSKKPKPAANVKNGNAGKPNGAKAAKSAKAAKPNGKTRKPAAATPAPKAKAAASDSAKAKAKKLRPDLTNKLLHMIAEEMAVEEAELTPSASFQEDLHLDAIDVAELLMQAESNFSLHPFNEEDWEGCETVGDFLALVQKRVDARRAKKPAKSGAKAASKMSR